GFAGGVGGPRSDLLIKQASPIGASGRVYGTVYSGLDVGFAVSPALFGLMMDQGWYQATLAGAALTLLLAVVAALAVGQRSAAAGLR
ncbi:MAG: MFS transporter, partial [Burkholderiaceae bacterium]